jgi:hypothetical protein
MTDHYHFNILKYEAVKTHFKHTLEHVIEAGHNVKEFTEFALNKFDESYIPHLRQFLSDVSQGEIKIKGLSKSAKTAIIGHHVSLKEREALIREAAYYLAEKRGFAGGHETDDWAAAEREVDTRLAEEARLIDKGRSLVESTATSIEKEFVNIKKAVTGWLETRHGYHAKRGVKKSMPKKSATKELGR